MNNIWFIFLNRFKPTLFWKTWNVGNGPLKELNLYHTIRCLSAMKKVNGDSLASVVMRSVGMIVWKLRVPALTDHSSGGDVYCSPITLPLTPKACSGHIWDNLMSWICMKVGVGVGWGLDWFTIARISFRTRRQIDIDTEGTYLPDHIHSHIAPPLISTGPLSRMV